MCAKMGRQTKQPGLIEMAKKRRHIALVEKLATGKQSTPSLTKSEIKELGQFESGSDLPGIVCSQEKVAKVFDVSVRTVQNWARDGMPVTQEGKYDLIDIRAWRSIKNNRVSGKKGNRKDDAEARYREAKACLAEIALKEKKGLLLNKRRVENELVQISLGIKLILLSLPQQVAPQLVGLDAQKINALLTARIREAIQEISDGKALMQKITAQNKNSFNNLNASDL